MGNVVGATIGSTSTKSVHGVPAAVKANRRAIRHTNPICAACIGDSGGPIVPGAELGGAARVVPAAAIRKTSAGSKPNF